MPKENKNGKKPRWVHPMSQIPEPWILLNYYFSSFKGKLLKGLIHNVNSPIQNISFLIEFAHQDLKTIKTSDKLLEYCTARFSTLKKQLAKLTEVLRPIELFERLMYEDRPLTALELSETVRELLLYDLYCKHHVKVNLDVASKASLLFPNSGTLIPVVCQLLDNALTALKTIKADKLTIHITETEIHIIDNGCGFDISNAAQLFEPWISNWPLELLPEEEQSHLGLGLYWTKKIMEAYNGSVAISRNQDTTISTIYLPRSEK